MASGSSNTSGSTVEFGETCVIKPKGKHKSTIVWLHGLFKNGSSCLQLLENLPLQNTKWICPTAPIRRMDILGGYNCTAWFHMGDLSEEGPEDFEGLDASAAHVANLLSMEPAKVKLGIGGFGMGAAIALYSATCFAQGKYGNGCAYPVNLRTVVGLSAWLPGSSYVRTKIEGSHKARRRAASLPILLTHRKCNERVPLKLVEKSYNTLYQAGYHSITIKTYEGFGHHTTPEEMDDLCNWLKRQGF